MSVNLHPSEAEALIAWRKTDVARIVKDILVAKLLTLPLAISRTNYSEALAAAQGNAARGVAELFDDLFENDHKPQKPTPPEDFGADHGN